MLPTMEIIRREAACAGLHLLAHESFGASYAKTSAEWRRRFLHMWPDIEAFGFDIRFKRMCEYYLSYCEVGFQAGAINVSLLTLAPSLEPHRIVTNNLDCDPSIRRRRQTEALRQR
jgi:cyclopropane-fatty-acyl-phospholipid synthase